MKKMRWLAFVLAAAFVGAGAQGFLDPAVVKRMTDAGLRATLLSPERTTTRMSGDLRTFAQVIKEANIRAE